MAQEQIGRASVSIKFKASPWLIGLTFVWGASQAISGLDGIPQWMKQTGFVVASGLAATGLLKANKEEKP